MGTIIAEKKQSGKTRFRAEVRREGQRLTKRFPTRHLAKRWISKVETEIAEGEFVPDLKRYTFGQLVDEYCEKVLPTKSNPETRKLYRSQLNWFKARIGDVKLCRLDEALLHKLREELRTEEIRKTPESRPYKRSDSTVNRYFTALRHCLSKAKRWKWIRDIPSIEKLAEPEGRSRFLSPEEARAILAELKRAGRTDVYLACKISLTYGSRLGETCALRWEDVDWEHRVLVFRETKNGLKKGLPIPKQLLSELLEWRNTSSASSDFVFPASQKSKHGHIYDKAKKGFLRACAALNISGVTYHTMRHTVASWTTQKGVNRKIIAEVLGHQDLRMTDRYSHLDSTHLLPVVELTERLLEEEDPHEFDA